MATKVKKWEDYLPKLVKYYKEHGDYDVPRRWQEDPGLGAWVDKQRVRKRKFDRGEPGEGMTAERVARLTALGFVWNKKDIQWEENLERLEAYNAVHGDCNIPARWAEDPSLGQWANRQRWSKKKFDRGEPSEGMTAERAARLTALCLDWDLDWKQRKDKKNLVVVSETFDEERSDESNMVVAGPVFGVPGPFDRKDEEWETQFVRLAAYKDAHGDCNVSSRWAEDPRLGNWVKSQRTLKRKLDRGEPSKGMTVERVVRLTALGLVWDTPWDPRPKNTKNKRVRHHQQMAEKVPTFSRKVARAAAWPPVLLPPEPPCAPPACVTSHVPADLDQSSTVPHDLSYLEGFEGGKSKRKKRKSKIKSKRKKIKSKIKSKRKSK
jgi:predicted secreted Zn-dependent protease